MFCTSLANMSAVLSCQGALEMTIMQAPDIIK